jgi:hypothetical protein
MITLADISALTVFACLIVLAWHFATKHGFAMGHAAGRCEERSWMNARVIQAKRHAMQQGIHFGCDHFHALMFRKHGIVIKSPVTQGATLSTQ